MTSSAAQEKGVNNEIKMYSSHDAPPSAPRTLPTRHSRHHAPPVASWEVLEKEYDRIVSSIPGTLIGAYS